jgi:SAM-dependent methyltransferase
MGAMSSKLDKYRDQIKTDWTDSPYYDRAEKNDWLDGFWAPQGLFFSKFVKLDLTNVVELACGHGRHAAKCIDNVGHITLIDVNDTNIDACRKRFAGNPKVSYLVNDGSSLSAIASDSLTSVFCYDAMVHFEAADVIAYVGEIARVLKTGGRALLHYSNCDLFPEGNYKDTPHWRNFFSEKMMRHFANRAGFEVLSSDIFCLGVEGLDIKIADAVTLFEKK